MKTTDIQNRGDITRDNNNRGKPTEWEVMRAFSSSSLSRYLQETGLRWRIQVIFLGIREEAAEPKKKWDRGDSLSRTRLYLGRYCKTLALSKAANKSDWKAGRNRFLPYI